MKIFLIVALMLVIGKPSESRPRYDTFADLYSSMGDIDWGKRSGYDNWISPMYGYSSMADTEWGWKKRSDEPAEDEEDADEAELEKRSGNRLNMYYTPYRQRQPYTLASSSYMPYKSLKDAIPSANTGSQPKSVIRNTRSRIGAGNRLYNYVSMADLDWGWKRKRSDNESKRNLASLAHDNGVPSRFQAPTADNSADKDLLAFLAQHYNLFKGGDLNRSTRSGISSGALPHHARR